eukprot:TRINITY_DN18377_c0_g1_i1.p1 TRINITY_DN18377_c0_g1~~TRINITY_DN18377_c0_g1_i1.p1  ORF type:complete len:143 (+),score=24.92 TRINITY_DN18377_c0_g1_i1:146-574(+)
MSEKHQWEKVFLPKPTWCHKCRKFIWGVTKATQNVLQCKYCEMVVHKDCFVGDTCTRVTIAPEPRPQTAPSTNNAVQPLAEACFDFPPENERELELKKGDIVEVYQICGEWWFGALVSNQKEGYFPGAYVKKLGDWELSGST